MLPNLIGRRRCEAMRSPSSDAIKTQRVNWEIGYTLRDTKSDSKQCPRNGP
jgi:hypothetical protein